MALERPNGSAVPSVSARASRQSLRASAISDRSVIRAKVERRETLSHAPGHGAEKLAALDRRAVGKNSRRVYRRRGGAQDAQRGQGQGPRVIWRIARG